MAEGLTTTRVVIDPAAMAQVLRGPNGPVYRHMIEQGEKVKLEAKRLVGVKSGNLRDHIIKRIGVDRGAVVVLVGAEVSYAEVHHEGSAPHVIRARNAPRLVFFWPVVGRVVAFKQVNHPGTVPNPYLVDALRVL